MGKLLLARAGVLVLGLGVILGWASTQDPNRREPPPRGPEIPRREEEPAPANRREAPPSRGAVPDVLDLSDEELVRHGEYLARHVAMCVHCHTPRHPDGVLDERRLFEGSAMPVASPWRGQRWCFWAPRLAGLPGGWTAEELIEFLQTGHTERRAEVRPPMPPFRLSQRDARAITAYFASLR